MAAQQIDDFTMPDEGGLVAVDVDGATVAVTVLDGQLYAFDDTCPHRRLLAVRRRARARVLAAGAADP